MNWTKIQLHNERNNDSPYRFCKNQKCQKVSFCNLKNQMVPNQLKMGGKSTWLVLLGKYREHIICHIYDIWYIRVNHLVTSPRHPLWVIKFRGPRDGHFCPSLFWKKPAVPRTKWDENPSIGPLNTFWTLEKSYYGHYWRTACFIFESINKRCELVSL